MIIEDKVAIVSGAASGIGRAVALALATKKAAAVVVADLNETGIEETCQSIEKLGVKALGVKTDVTKIADLENLYNKTISAFGQLDIVHNNAGLVSGPPAFPDNTAERAQLVIDVNFSSVVLSTTIAMQHMRERGGVIINTASTGGMNPFKSDAPYSSAKAAVIHFTKCCAEFNDDYNIRVNTISPGITRTPILEATGGGVIPDWLKPRLEGRNVLEPEDMAQAVVNIIEDDSLVGENVVINDPNFNK